MSPFNAFAYEKKSLESSGFIEEYHADICVAKICPQPEEASRRHDSQSASPIVKSALLR